MVNSMLSVDADLLVRSSVVMSPNSVEYVMSSSVVLG